MLEVSRRESLESLWIRKRAASELWAISHLMLPDFNIFCILLGQEPQFPGMLYDWRQWQISQLCVVAWELGSQLWAAEFLQPAVIEKGGQSAFLRRSIRLRKMARIRGSQLRNLFFLSRI